MILYHTTQKRNRGAIKRYGLLPRSTNDHNYPTVGQQPRGVFTTRADDYLFLHRRLECDRFDPWRDVWRIDAAGLTTVADCIIPARVITCAVPPERLTLVGSWHFERDWDTLVNTGEALWRKFGQTA